MSKCVNCGEEGPHFVPPSLGELGFYTCKKKPGFEVVGTCPACGINMEYEVVDEWLENGDNVTPKMKTITHITGSLDCKANHFRYLRERINWWKHDLSFKAPEQLRDRIADMFRNLNNCIKAGE